MCLMAAGLVEVSIFIGGYRRSVALQVAIDVLHLGRLDVRSEVLSILVAAQCLLLWLKIQYFAR